MNEKKTGYNRAENQLLLYMQSLVMLKETRGYLEKQDLTTLIYFARKAQMFPNKLSVWTLLTTYK